MKGINDYFKELSTEDIDAGVHRDFIGGHWDLLGKLQLDFMRDQGLKPDQKVLDIGCGALRAGIPLTNYLNATCYYGTDVNESLIEAAHIELVTSDLASKNPVLRVDKNFELGRLNAEFDFILAQSLFTHLFSNHIIRCLVNVKRVMKPRGKFFASFLEAPEKAWLEPILHGTNGIVSQYDCDPFHQSIEEYEIFSDFAELNVKYIGDWGHPRNAKMLLFTHK